MLHCVSSGVYTRRCSVNSRSPGCIVATVRARCLKNSLKQPFVKVDRAQGQASFAKRGSSSESLCKLEFDDCRSTAINRECLAYIRVKLVAFKFK